MLRVAEEQVGGCRTNERTEWYLICDNKWAIHKKLIRLLRLASPCAPRTWINRAVILLSMLNVVLAHTSDVASDGEDDAHFTRQWAVHIEGGHEVANQIAAKHGFVNLGKIFQDFYHFEHEHLAKRSLTPHPEHHRNLTNEAEVKWAQQQVIKRRSKRDLISPRPRTKSSARLKSNSVRFNDVEWPHMWYLNRGQGLDMNVEGAWREGISGSGVVVTILDDGLEKDHPDLMANYDPEASYDVNNHDEDPMPRYDPVDSNRHGTRCAGEVAAVANNSLCSVGVAFGANVGGVKMLDGDVTDAVEARSLSLNPQHIDIYSASWGPDDDGKTVDGPGELATRAFIEGVTKGRQGKGSIFVWASGNGGREHDNCNCDGYTNSIWTLSISSATENGLVPWYSEACSSTLATTYSSGSLAEKQIVTTDLHHKCTDGHTGTSASAPLAAGICALALEANRNLTWRDMQHIVVRTARPANLKSSDWKVNGVGRNVSHSFGYGLMDATAMVKLARTWKTVPEQHRCEVSAPHRNKSIPPRSKVILDLNVTECPGVNFLEHVQAKISLSSQQRGDLQIYLTSPAGTRSTLLARRPKDSSKNPFNSWPFMSVHTWGEMPFGIWQLEIHNGGGFLGRANLQDWSLVLYGTLHLPQAEPQNQRSSQRFSAKTGSSDRANAFHLGSKANKTSPATQVNGLNRKNLKTWKAKPTGTRTGKISAGGSPEAPRVSDPGAPSRNAKTQKFWQPSRAKDPGTGKGLARTTPGPPSNLKLPLTIVLGPGVADLSASQNVPDIFQKYPKVQQLFPVYVNTGRIYSDENILLPKIELRAPYFPNANPKPFANGQKTERQNRYDTSSLTRISAEGRFNGNRRPMPRKQQMQGQLDNWQMLFYGTEVAPNNEESHLSGVNRGKNKLKDVLASELDLGDDVSNHLEAGTGNRGWKDQATRRDDVTRTTMDPMGRPSSGCALPVQPNSQCIDSAAEGCRNSTFLWIFESEVLDFPSIFDKVDEQQTSHENQVAKSISHVTRWRLGAEEELSQVREDHLAPEPVSTFNSECVPGLYLYGGQCEANCPPTTYPGINAKERAVCLPCHYTCLTCSGESDGHCVSCRAESVPVPSGLKERVDSMLQKLRTGGTNAERTGTKSDVKVEDLSVDEVHLSWGKRSAREVWAGHSGGKATVSKKAVTKKILEPYGSPRDLFYCYPARMLDQIKSSDTWYYRMSVLFGLNLTLLIGILIFLLCKWYRLKKKNVQDGLRRRYVNMPKGDSVNEALGEIIYLSSSSEDEYYGDETGHAKNQSVPYN